MSLPSKILKFGGSSLSQADSLQHVYEIVSAALLAGEHLAVSGRVVPGRSRLQQTDFQSLHSISAAAARVASSLAKQKRRMVAGAAPWSA